MLNKTKLNQLKKKIFEELKLVSEDNSKLRYTKCNIVIHFDHFEDVNSDLGWYIYWGEGSDNILNEDQYEIRPLFSSKSKSSQVYKEMLRVLDNPVHSKKDLSNSVAATITDLNDRVLFTSRNLKSENNKTDKHAEQILIEKIKECSLPVEKLKIYVTLIPCIECFKKIYSNNNIVEIIYLKDYRSTLVFAQHREYIKSLSKEKRRRYLIRTESLKSDDSRRICYHHDAYLIQQRVTDIIEKKWFKGLAEGGVKVAISEINYTDLEKLMLLVKYVDKDVMSMLDDKNGGSIFINKTKFEEEINYFVDSYKGNGANNKLVNQLELEDNTI